MAWTAPATAVAGTTLTAAFWNTHVRDNLLETAAAKAANAGGILVATGSNALAERVWASDYIATQQTTASTSFTDLATAGPTVTITTGTKAIVVVTAQMVNTVSASEVDMGVDVSSATTIAAAVATSWQVGIATNAFAMASRVIPFGMGGASAALTAGSNVFKAEYKVAAGTGAWQFREISVLAL